MWAVEREREIDQEIESFIETHDRKQTKLDAQKLPSMARQ